MTGIYLKVPVTILCFRFLFMGTFTVHALHQIPYLKDESLAYVLKQVDIKCFTNVIYTLKLDSSKLAPLMNQDKKPSWFLSSCCLLTRFSGILPLIA
jgi:hypothetical protein